MSRMYRILILALLAGIAQGQVAGSPGVTGGSSTGGSSFPVVTGVNVNTGGSVVPGGIGQNVANQFRTVVGPPLPAVTMTLTGGSLLNGHSAAIRFTFNSAAGETLPGQELSGGYVTLSGGTCNAGSACTLTVIAPTIPSGFTGYTVYIADAGTAAAAQGAETKQSATPNCVNITINCVITGAAIGGGGAMPTTTTAYSFPSPLGTNLCSPGTNPFMFLGDSTNTFYPYMGVDASNTGSNPPAPYNKLVFCRPVWFNDTAADPPPGKNAMILFAHVQNGVDVNIANQDRALYSTSSNCFPNIQTCADSAAHYALEGIQVEQDIVGTPTINGSPDAEVTAGSFQTSLNTNGTNYSTNGFGTNAVRAELFRQTGAGSDNGGEGMNGIIALVSNQSTVSAAGGAMAAVHTFVGSSVNAVSLFGAHIISDAAPNTGLFPSGMQGWRIKTNGSFAPAANYGGTTQDWLIRNQQRNWNTYLNGTVFLNGLQNSDAIELPSLDPLSAQGSVRAVASLQPVNSATPVCGGGASTYNYVIVGFDANGGAVSSNTINTPGTCVNPLTGPNPVTFNPVIMGKGVVTYSVYRTGGPMGLGRIIAAATCGNTVEPWMNGCNNIVDNGLTATAATIPSVNSTGGLGAVGYSSLAGNKFVVGSSGFTTANNTSFQAITGLIMNLSPLARTYSFSCHGAYSQATAAVAVAFGIQSATVAPTNIFATGKQQIAAATAPAPQLLATLNTTTATGITTGTPGVIATNYTFDLDGTIEEPANDQGNIINIMVSTATGADAVTVLRGSYCYLY